MGRPNPQVKAINPPGVYNPNWKGPMPLYPDELNNIMPQLPEALIYRGNILLPQTMKAVENTADEGANGGTCTTAPLVLQYNYMYVYTYV